MKVNFTWDFVKPLLITGASFIAVSMVMNFIQGDYLNAVCNVLWIIIICLVWRMHEERDELFRLVLIFDALTDKLLEEKSKLEDELKQKNNDKDIKTKGGTNA